MAEGLTIQQPDLKSVVKGLRSAPERLDKDLRKRFREIAAEVRDKARAAAAGGHPQSANQRPRLNQPQHWSTFVNAIRSGDDGGNPYVAGGKAGLAWGGGAEFGSKGGPGKRQFKPFQKSGYFFFPAVAAEKERVNREVLDALETVLSAVDAGA